MNLSLLQNFKTKNLKSYPFPHIIIENALPQGLFKQLLETVPNSMIENLNLNNHRGDIKKESLINSPQYKLWYDFLNYHSSQGFIHEVISHFKNEVNSSDLDRILLDLEQGEDHEFKSKKKISVSAAYSYNTPVKDPSSTRGVHLDHYRKMFFGLYYLRKPEDDTVGGDLTLYKWKDEITEYDKKRILYTSKFNRLNEYVKEYKVVKYSQNKLMFALNSLNTLHGVTTRQKSKFVRQFCYFYSNVNFDFIKQQSSLRDKILYKNISIFQKLKIIIYEVFFKKKDPQKD